MDSNLTRIDLINDFNESFREPTYTLNLSEHGTILTAHYSSYEWTQDIMLIAFANKIIVAQLNHHDNLHFKILAEFQHNVICTNLYLSSETTVSTVPLNIQFCTAGVDFKLRVFKGNISDENTCQELVGHTSYINDISYDPENIYIVSASDDHSAKIWTVANNKYAATLKLTSPGMSTNWHKEDNSKLLVAEKSGIIRFYNVSTQKPILCFDYGKPLASAHWAPSDSQLIASLHMGELLLWDTIHLSRPIQNKLIYAEAGGVVKFSPGADLIATVNNVESSMKVLHVKTQQERLCAKLTLPGNITWHFRIPIICVGNGEKLCFWKIVPK